LAEAEALNAAEDKAFGTDCRDDEISDELAHRERQLAMTRAIDDGSWGLAVAAVALARSPRPLHEFLGVPFFTVLSGSHIP